MNPYYATGFLSALFFWVWPAFLYRNLGGPLADGYIFFALLLFGAGKAASEFHIRVFAPKHPPRGRTSSIAVMCFAIVAVALLTRVAYHAYMGE